MGVCTFWSTVYGGHLELFERVSVQLPTLQLMAQAALAPKPSGAFQQRCGMKGQYVYWIAMSHPLEKTIARLGLKVPGDFSREEDRHLPQAEIPNMRPDVVICEATYGTHIHEPRETREAR